MADTPVFDPEQLCQELRVRGDEWAQADAAWRALEDAEKSIWSECFIEADATTVAAKEALAHTAPKYREHLAAKSKARRAANLAKVKYTTWEAYMEMRRTQESTKRAELAALKG